MKEFATDLVFPEGPVSLPGGSAAVVEVAAARVTVIDRDGLKTSHDVGGSPNGAALGPDGALYICNSGGFTYEVVGKVKLPMYEPPDFQGGSIQRLDLESGEVRTLYTTCDGERFVGPNDLAFDAHGGFYFTDTGKGRERSLDRGGIYYGKADGSAVVQVVYPLLTPNGIGVSPDGSTLYAVESFPGRLWAWPIESPGVLTFNPPGRINPGLVAGRLVYTFPDGQLPDSLAIDGEGNINVGTVVSGVVNVISPSGELVEQVAPPGDDQFVTNICFGVDDLRTAYITSSGAGILYEATWPRDGLRLPF